MALCRDRQESFEENHFARFIGQGLLAGFNSEKKIELYKLTYSIFNHNNVNPSLKEGRFLISSIVSVKP